MRDKESKQRILDAALSVVAKRSINGTRMQLIAQEADMSQANLHYHFATKERLLTALTHEVQDAYTRWRLDAVSACGNDLESQLRALFQNKKQQILEKPDYDRVEFDFWVTSQSDEAIRTVFRQDFQEWHAHMASVLRKCRPSLTEAQASLLARSMMSMMKGAAMQFLLEPNFDLEQYFDLCFHQIMYTIRTYTSEEPVKED